MEREILLFQLRVFIRFPIAKVKGFRAEESI